jgi:LuxR family transcriptional regulator, maltose regulon positive regulatory protein
MLHSTRALLEFVRGRHEDAMTAERAAEGVQRGFATRHIVAIEVRALKVEMLVRVGETGLVRRALDAMDDEVRAAGEMRVVLATLRLAQDDPQGAGAALEPIFADASPLENPRWEIQALLLKASAEDALGDGGASSRALDRALELAEPLREALSETELRVLRYLPTNLRGPEIASELFVSLNTIRAHLRSIYAKLGVHSRADAVNRARELGLLSPSSRNR